MVDQARYVFAVRNRIAVDEDYMQSNAQVGQPPCALDRIGRRRRSHHEARGTENPAAMSRLNGGIDLRAEPEVVRGDNQMVQWTNSCRQKVRIMDVSQVGMMSCKSSRPLRRITLRFGPRPRCRLPPSGSRRPANELSPRRSSPHTRQTQ